MCKYKAIICPRCPDEENDQRERETVEECDDTIHDANEENTEEVEEDCGCHGTPELTDGSTWTGESSD